MRTLFWVLPLVIGIFVRPVAAQTGDLRSYLPLTPGATWYYDLIAVFSRGTGNSTSRVSGAVWTALDSATVASRRFPRLQIREGSEPPTTCIVDVRVAPTRTAFYLLDETGQTTCDVDHLVTTASDGSPVPGFVLEDSTVATESVTIGHMTYDSETTAYGWDYFPSDVYYDRNAARMIGIIEYNYSFYYFGPAGSSFLEYREARLRRVEMNGTTYGAPIVPQPEFWPLAIGNRWEYVLEDETGADRGAVAWTVVPDGSGVAVRLEHVEQGGVVSAVTCPATILLPSPESSWRTRFLLNCTLPEAMLVPNLWQYNPQIYVDHFVSGIPISIGTQNLEADLASEELNDLTPTSQYRTSWKAARDIGLTEYVVRYQNTSTSWTWTATLGYALVNGVTYGQRVVSSDEATSSVRLSLSAGPTPTTGALTVRYALPSPATARIQVIDALGRVVQVLDLGTRPAGAGMATLDGASLAPGVYALRLTADDEVKTVRVVVAR